MLPGALSTSSNNTHTHTKLWLFYGSDVPCCDTPFHSKTPDYIVLSTKGEVVSGSIGEPEVNGVLMGAHGSLVPPYQVPDMAYMYTYNQENRYNQQLNTFNTQYFLIY